VYKIAEKLFPKYFYFILIYLRLHKAGDFVSTVSQSQKVHNVISCCLKGKSLFKVSSDVSFHFVYVTFCVCFCNLYLTLYKTRYSSSCVNHFVHFVCVY